MNNSISPDYHPQINCTGQAGRLGSTIIPGLRHNVSEYQTDWDTYQLPLTLAYNVLVHRTIKVSSLRLALTRTLPRPATVARKRTNLAKDNDIMSPMYDSV